jgi:hypothetical protein
MTSPLSTSLPVASSSTCCPIRFKRFFFALLLVLPLLAARSSAQTTTISGTVYDPRTTNPLPLPNVLVYVTTGTPAALPAGVQCLTSTNSTPSDPDLVSSTFTAVDGTFTLANVPVNATYTVVIQAGKWRRQFLNQAVAAVPLAGLALHMPADHTQGDIPMIAISTGSVDALECVFRQMGIADTEFTDDNGAVNRGGHIHLYMGSDAPGAVINASTPNETVLMGSSTLIDSYDMLMFPCQGGAYNKPLAAQNNLLDYANIGGRVFATHFSFVWLDPNSPDPSYPNFVPNSQFPAIANWTTSAEQEISSGVGTVNTNFSDGATMAQWLQNAGSTVTGTGNQIDISTLRTDVGSVVAPTQSWLTLNSGTYSGQSGNPVMQMTFNAPVGAPAASQCGRVVYNDYHVFNASSTGAIYPAECPASSTMSAQEQMLEYALFDLSSFVTPVIIPTLSIGFNPSPLIVKAGDTADQVTIDVTNISSTVEIYSSVVLTLQLPYGLTATALADPTGGWTCTVSSLTCTRTTSMAASASDSVILTVSIPAYTSTSTTTGTITATASSPNFSNNVTGTGNVIFQQPPAITWPTPANIVYGTPLSGAQLDATSPVAGKFSYTPSAGTVLTVGQHTLSVAFSPTDTTDYTTSSASVILTVVPVTPSLGLTSNANPVFLANAVTFTATIASQAVPPTGTITFYDGAAQIGTGTVSSGQATFTTTALSSLIHSITAVYSGDSSYGPATSSLLSENVADFTIVPQGGGAASVPAASVASFPLVISPVGASTLPGTMSLGVTGLSLGATASFSPSSVTAGSGATTVTLQVTLPGKAALEQPPAPFSRKSLPLALSLILLPFAPRLRKAARRWRSLFVLALLGIALSVGLTACGSNAQIKSQGYSLTVTAASGGLSHTTTLSLTIQ